MIPIPIDYSDNYVTAKIALTVIAMHKQADDDPLRLDFRDLNSERSTFLDPRKKKGSIYFLLRLKYFVVNKDATGLSEGLVNYRCTFEYEFGPGGEGRIDAKDLTVYSPVVVREPYSEGELGAVGLVSFTPSVEYMGQTVRFIRITPVIATRSFSSTSSGITIGLESKVISVEGTVGGGVTEIPVQTGVPNGYFKLNLYVYPVDLAPTVSVIPEEFRKAMVVSLLYSEAEVRLSSDRQMKLLAWITTINKKYPRLADAVRRGGPLLHVDGYASITGTPLKNQSYATLRSEQVKTFVAHNLAVPVDKISAKPFGSQNAQWHFDFETPDRVKAKPRDEDRLVLVWFDVDEAWKIAGDGVR